MADNLQAIFRNKNIFAILSLLLSEPEKKFYLREIARRLRLSSGAIHSDLAALESSGLASSLVQGRNKYFSANQQSRHFPALRDLFKDKIFIQSERLVMTILFEEHWVSPLTQIFNYFGWQAFISDPGWQSRPRSYAGVYRGNFLQFSFHEESWISRSQEVLSRLGSPALARKNYRDFIQIASKMRALILKMEDISQVNEVFISDLTNLYVLGIEACRIGYLGVSADLPGEGLSRKMREILEQRTQGLDLQETVPELVNRLSAPPELSLSFIRERTFLQLALQAARLAPISFKKDKIFLDKLNDYRCRYYWTDFGHFGHRPELAEMAEEISSLLKKETPAKLQRRLKEIEKYPSNIKTEKDIWFKRLKLSRSEKTIFESAGLFSLVKALRLEHLSGLNSQIKALVDYLAAKHHLDGRLLYFSTFGEILEIYRSGLKPGWIKILKERSKLCVLLVGDDYFDGQIITGSEARDFCHRYVREVKREINDIENFHGSVAYPGKARGPVKVINSPREMDKMRDGDILVTTQTIPEMLPAMRQASAFITNTGGITCHAAIVAREMKKPCIVGTKIATHVLHDGDFVQVDAYKGIINIIRIN